MTLGVDVDFSIGNFSIGFQVQAAGSIVRNESGTGWRVQYGRTYGFQVSGALVALDNEDRTLVQNVRDGAAVILMNSGGSAHGEVGVFVGQDGNAAEVDDLGGNSVEMSGYISRKRLTRSVARRLGRTAEQISERLPNGYLSGEYVSGGSFIAGDAIHGVQLGLGTSVGHAGTTLDGVDSQVDVLGEFNLED